MVDEDDFDDLFRGTGRTGHQYQPNHAKDFDSPKPFSDKSRSPRGCRSLGAVHLHHALRTMPASWREIPLRDHIGLDLTCLVILVRSLQSLGGQKRQSRPISVLQPGRILSSPNGRLLGFIAIRSSWVSSSPRCLSFRVRLRRFLPIERVEKSSFGRFFLISGVLSVRR